MASFTRWDKEALLADVVGFETNELAVRGADSILSTASGMNFIDLTSGIAVHALGHTHPEIVQAIKDQAGRVIHTSDIMRHSPQLELARKIRELIAATVPGEPWTVQFMNSGSESIDAAAKLAIKVTGRSKFLTFYGAFHGRTLFSTALSCSNVNHRHAYEPILSHLDSSILRAAPSREGSGTDGQSIGQCLTEVKSLIEQHPGEIAAIFIEAQQGEGGYFPMRTEDAHAIRELASRDNILLIADEIQSGFGRTGRWFGFEHLSIGPDIVVFGKAVGGGLPLAGVAASRSLMAKWSPGEHGTTFGGNPVACAAGLAALRLIESGELVERAYMLGGAVKLRLSELIGTLGVFDVRGNGLMIGIEVRDAMGQPDYERVKSVKDACRDRGVLILGCGAKIGVPSVDNATIRLLPALNISDNTLECSIDKISEALTETFVAQVSP